jgi:hypothetical protein
VQRISSSQGLDGIMPLLSLYLVTKRGRLVTLLLTMQQLKIKLAGPLLR